MNDWLLDMVNGTLAGRWDVLDDGMTWLAANGVFVLAALAVVLGVREVYRAPQTAVRIAMTTLAIALLTGAGLLVAGHLVHESRPFVHDADTIQLMPHGADNSFPSDHAALAAVIALAASLAWRPWAAVFLALGVLVSAARIYVGVHYPGDVLASWLLAAVATALVLFVTEPRTLARAPRSTPTTTA